MSESSVFEIILVHCAGDLAPKSPSRLHFSKRFESAGAWVIEPTCGNILQDPVPGLKPFFQHSYLNFSRSQASVTEGDNASTGTGHFSSFAVNRFDHPALRVEAMDAPEKR
jgi:hypothetical protein